MEFHNFPLINTVTQEPLMGLGTFIFCAATALCALLVVLVRLDRSAPKSWKESRLKEYKFDPLVMVVFKEKNPHLNDDQCTLAFEGLKNYFLLLLMHKSARGKGSLAMPSKLVDDAWHAFILCTEKYQEFCKIHFGQFIHHYPHPSSAKNHGVITEAPQLLEAAMLRTWQLAKSQQLHQAQNQFNTAATPDRRTPAYGKWDETSTNSTPLLFSIDNRANISRGMIWTDQMLSAIATACQNAKEGLLPSSMKHDFLANAAVATGGCQGSGGCSGGDDNDD